MKKIELDAREMEHPVPLEKATSILKELDDEKYLYMVHRKNPIPLIEIAKGRGFQVLNREIREREWHIIIVKNPNTNLDELLDV